MVRSTSPNFSCSAIRHLVCAFDGGISVVSEGHLHVSSLKVPVCNWHQSCYGKLPSSLLDNMPNLRCLELNEVHPTLGASSQWFVKQGKDEHLLHLHPWGMCPAWGGDLLTAGVAGWALTSVGVWLRKQDHGFFQSKSLKRVQAL